jgi:hypothetical protein
MRTFWVLKSFRLNQAFETTICFELLWTFTNHFKTMNNITKCVLENSRKSNSPSVLYIVNTLGFFVTNVWHFFHAIKFFNVLNYEFKTMSDTRIPHIVWVFNNSHHAHKAIITYIVNQNLYDIGRPYIFYNLFNVTMDINSCKARSSFILVKFNNMFQFQISLPSHFAFQRTKIIKDNKSKLQINKSSAYMQSTFNMISWIIKWTYLETK